MNLKNETVLVTGGAGFIGSHLVRLLIQQGVKPHVVTRNARGNWRMKDLNKKYVAHSADLTSRTTVQKLIKKVKPTVVYHLASYGVVSGQVDQAKLRGVNLDATVHLIEACKELKTFSHFIHTGSCFEYGSHTSRMTETSELLPETDYAVYKVASTMYAMKTAIRDNFPVTVLRPFTAYGPYEAKPRLIPTLMLAAVNSKRPQVSSPKPVRNFVYVEDVARAYIVVTGKKRTFGEIYNVCTAQEYSVGEVLQYVEKVSGQSLQPRYNKALMRAYEPATWLASYQKLKQATGWKPRYSITQGLRATYEWFQHNKDYYGPTGRT